MFLDAADPHWDGIHRPQRLYPVGLTERKILKLCRFADVRRDCGDDLDDFLPMA
ncbi:hypothetical protein [Micromonospora nigra]|uniref:hypothetical protein n=1 Tax=Micromonospora nigra TaxID=145857 RepID=UPI0015864344|nr:hypothetical protein [Micromonospora nigra]